MPWQNVWITNNTMTATNYTTPYYYSNNWYILPTATSTATTLSFYGSGSFSPSFYGSGSLSNDFYYWPSDATAPAWPPRVPSWQMNQIDRRHQAQLAQAAQQAAYMGQLQQAQAACQQASQWPDSRLAQQGLAQAAMRGLARAQPQPSVGREQRAIIAAHPKTAQDRARELLLSHLTPEQRETFERNKWFVVRGGKSGKLYRIKDQGNMVANIEELFAETTAASHRLCAHCSVEKYPMGDQLLAQKLMLESEEEAFLGIANRHAA